MDGRLLTVVRDCSVQNSEGEDLMTAINVMGYDLREVQKGIYAKETFIR